MKRKIETELYDLIKPRFRFDESKREAIERDNKKLESEGNCTKYELETKKYFYTEKTVKKYVEEGVAFVEWVNKQTGKDIPITSEKIKDYIKPYLLYKMNKGYSPYTLYSTRSYLGKIFQVDLKNIQLPPKSTNKKSRKKHKHIFTEEEKKMQTRFYKAIGARRNEYRFLTMEEAAEFKKNYKEKVQIHKFKSGKISNLQFQLNEEGIVESILILIGKGKKSRIIEILPEDRSFITKVYREDLYTLFFNPADCETIENTRREYAKNLYLYYKDEDFDLADNRNAYLCRGEIYGDSYDKRALNHIAKSMGIYTNVNYEIVHNYLN